MKDFKYYGSNPYHYPNKDDYKRYNVYKEDQVLRIDVSSIEDVYEIPEVAEVISGKSFPKHQYKTCVFDLCSKHKIVIFEYYDNDLYLDHKKQYNEESGKRHDEFINDIFEEFHVTDNPKRDKCFSLAWEYGHSSGYSEVYNHFSDLVELIQ